MNSNSYWCRLRSDYFIETINCKEGKEFSEAASCLQYSNKKCILTAECTPRKSKARFLISKCVAVFSVFCCFFSNTFTNLTFDFLGVHSADKMHFLLGYCKQLAASKNSLPSLQKQRSKLKFTFNEARLAKSKLYYIQ